MQRNPRFGIAPDLFLDHDTPVYVPMPVRENFDSEEEWYEALGQFHEVDFTEEEWASLSEDDQEYIREYVDDKNADTVKQYIVGQLQAVIARRKEDAEIKSVIQGLLTPEIVSDLIEDLRGRTHRNNGDDFEDLLEEMSEERLDAALRKVLTDVENYDCRYEDYDPKGDEVYRHDVGIGGAELEDISVTLYWGDIPSEVQDSLLLLSEHWIDRTSYRVADELNAGLATHNLSTFIRTKGHLKISIPNEISYIADVDSNKVAKAVVRLIQAPSAAQLHQMLRYLASKGVLSPLGRGLATLSSLNTPRQIEVATEEIRKNIKHLPENMRIGF